MFSFVAEYSWGEAMGVSPQNKKQLNSVFYLSF